MLPVVVINNCCKRKLLDLMIYYFQAEFCFDIIQAKRALRALRGLERLRLLMEGPVVKRQANSTLRSMQTLAHVQSQIRSRRLRMLEETQALQKQLLQKHTKELESMQVSGLNSLIYFRINNICDKEIMCIGF